MAHIANARMYSVNPAARAAWRDLFGWLARESGVALDVIDHAFPLPLSGLWSRRDLACAFMCGLPFMHAVRRPWLCPLPIAAPIPRDAPAPGRPVYATRLIVRADTRSKTLESTFGGRLGYTVEDSHSGYNALRHHLLAYRVSHGDKLYRKCIGPLHTPRRVIDAILAGDIDVGPLDSYAFDLMLRHEPELNDRIRIVASTEAAPIPLLVASPDCPADIVDALRAALLRFGVSSNCAELCDRLCLERFAAVEPADYELIARWEQDAIAAGYDRPA
jgi:ABC-type phosphate/phosphonate transport system substrate-binding protein